MSKNNIEVEEIEDVNWQQYFHEPLRVAHETSLIEPVPQNLGSMPADKRENAIDEAIEKRLKIMAGLAREIYNLRELKER